MTATPATTVAATAILCLALLPACAGPKGSSSAATRETGEDTYSDPSEVVHRPPPRPALWPSTMSSEDSEGRTHVNLRVLSLVVPIDERRSTYAYIVVNGYGAEIEYHWEKLVTPDFPEGLKGKVEAYGTKLVHSRVAGADPREVDSAFRGSTQWGKWGMHVTTVVPEAR